MMNYWCKINDYIKEDLLELISNKSLNNNVIILTLSSIGLNIEKSNIENIEVIGKIPYLNKIRCKFCGKCVEYCKTGLIEFQRDVPNVVFDMLNCNFCGNCINKCSSSAIKFNNRIIGYLRVETLSKNIKIIEAIKKYPNYKNYIFIEHIKKLLEKSGVCIIIHSEFSINDILKITENSDYEYIVVSSLDKNEIKNSTIEKFTEVDINIFNFD